MILSNPKLDYKIEKITQDKNGRFIIAKLITEDTHFILVNVYLPNDVNQQVLFLKDLQNQLQEFPHENIIIGGDFNCALTQCNKRGGNPVTRKLSVINEIKKLCELYDLRDTWRSVNPDAFQFTWRDKSLKVQCRLDYFLISNELNSLVSDCRIVFIPSTDHSAVQLNLISEESKQKKGPGFWKFNYSLLKDNRYISRLRENLPQFKSKYQNVEDLGLPWDLIKMEIRGFTVKYTKIKARERHDEEKFLQNSINDLIAKTEKNKNNKTIIYELNSTKARLNKIIAYKTCGTILRSRARWHEQGERNTKYFYSLEKRNYSRKVVTKLKLNDSSYTTNESDILEEQKRFYENLYKSQLTSAQSAHENEIFFNPNAVPTLNADEQALCEGLITETEALNALKDFSANKTPGTDGLSVEFLKYFWPELKNSIVDSFNHAFHKGSLSISQRCGIITLIPKKNKDKTILENLRPISLLNVDYKILTKVLAKRLEKVLPNLINADQTGYVKVRYIGENIRLIQDLMFYTNKENLPGMAIFLDFRKAFDTIEWHYLEKVLTHFNFGPNFLQWFKTLHADISSCVLNNGHASCFFPINHGVRQGCPLSGLLFVIGLELLARAIKRDNLIKGISTGEKEIKISMYADDTTVFVRDLDSITHLLNILKKFASLSGLQINTSNTEALWLGLWKDRPDTPFNFNYPQDPICALGVFFS